MRFISLADKLLRIAPQAHRAATLDVQQLAMRNAPVRTGDFRRRIRAEFFGEFRSRVGTDHPGGRIREFGGVIRAVRKRFLHFKTRDGRWVKVRQVTQRPGGYSNGFRPWLRPAAYEYPRFMAHHLRRLWP